MNYSKQQQQVIDTVLSGKSVASPACAGAGKSSTVRPLMNQLASKGVSCMSVPFMNSLYSEEMAAMPNVDVLNAHKRGNRMQIGRPTFENNKVRKIAEAIDGKNAEHITEIVNKFKAESYGVTNYDPDSIVTKYGLSPEYMDAALQCLSISDKNQNVIDYNDMLRFPVINGLKRPHKGMILIDEAQDYSPLMRDFLSLFIGPETKGLIAGDPERQALQQFAGADPESFNILANMLNCEYVPLTYNFRCGRNIVANANDFFPSDMEAAPGAIDGMVGECMTDSLESLDSDSAVLCEMNSPLLSFVITQIEKDRPVQFRPGKLWDKCKSVMWGLMDTRKCPIGMIAQRAEEKVQEYAGENGPDPDKLESIKCVGLLETLCMMRGITQVKWKFKTPVHPIEQILTEISAGNQGPMCMTGHTAKGLQWDDVYHIQKEPKPRPGKQQQQWEIHQWRCVGYVIRTRAKKNHYSLIG